VLALYQITQEALNNVAKHAGTRQVAIRLDLGGADDCLEIADQGCGFDPQIALAQRGHLGLAGIAERAEAVGWQLSLDSQPGKGTRIRVSPHRLQETP
jgi:signal transduction histidine kinase